MARKALAKPVREPLPPDTALEGVVERIKNGHLVAGLQDDRDVVNQLIGQVRMAGASEQFFRTVRISQLVDIKENKRYRGLAGQKSANGSEFSGTWEGFCQAIGMSADQVDRDILAYREFGEEALQRMREAGIGYRELVRLRHLPDDQKAALIEVAKSEDKEEILTFAEDLIARQADEKKKLAAQLDDANADIKAKDAVNAAKEKQIEGLQKQLTKATLAFEAATPDEQDEMIRGRAQAAAYRVRTHLNTDGDDVSSVRHYVRLLSNTGTDTSHKAFLGALLVEIEQDIKAIRMEFALPSTISEDADADVRQLLGEP